MTDMMIQDPIDEMDDLRSIGDTESRFDDQDDLRGLADEEAVAPVSSLETGETQIVEEEADEPIADLESTESEEDSADETDEEDEIEEEVVAVHVASPVDSTAKAAPVVAFSTSPVEPTVKPEPVASVAPIKEEQPVVAQVSTAAAEPKASSSDDEYNPSMALKVFMILRQGFIRFFDVVLTLVAIIFEQIMAVDWAGIFGSIVDFFGMLNEMMKERVPQKYHLLVYGVIAILFFGLPVGFGAVSFLSNSNNSDTVANGQTVNISQPSGIVPDNGILAPLFTPTVQQWAEDIARWTANTEITPDMFATVMQLESCGNPTVQGGLFGVGDDNTTLHDTEAQAMTAIQRLQSALLASNGDFPMAMAIYADGENALTADFSTWTFHARDMYILGRNILNQAKQGSVSSPDLNSWLQNTGSVLCTEAQTTFNN